MSKRWNPWPWVPPGILAVVVIANVVLIRLSVQHADERVDRPDAAPADAPAQP